MIHKKLRFVAAVAAMVLLAVSCGDSSNGESSSGTSDVAGEKTDQTLVIGAIPDQDAELLARNYELLANYLSDELDVPVEFKPVTEYSAAVTQFKVGDLDLVWFGGLTGVQAQLAVEGSEAIVQRDIDAVFTSVFIANKSAGIESFTSVDGLEALKGKRFTFGSESSTSGRLMPQSFLTKAGVTLDDFAGDPGFSGNHDATIEVVEAGSFEAGVASKAVWDKRVEEEKVDTSKVEVVFETPEYFDYQWVAHPELEKFGPDFKEKISEALLGLDSSDPDQKQILEFFGAEKFIPTDNENYAEIEQVGRDSGLIK